MFKKTMKITSNTISVLLFLVLLVIIFLVISSRASGGEPQVFGYQIKTVLSGSMEPTFKTGSIIALKEIEDKAALQKGDIITYLQDHETIVTHRIVEVVKNGGETMYRTKGDNNEEADTEMLLSSNVVAKYANITVPYLGYFIDYAKFQNGMAILMAVPGVTLLIYSIVVIMQALKEIDQAAKKRKESLQEPPRTSV